MANADTVGVLVSACRECVNACESLQRLVPELQLTSPFAKTVHELIYTVGGVEAVLHQFIDRELLQEAPANALEAPEEPRNDVRSVDEAGKAPLSAPSALLRAKSGRSSILSSKFGGPANHRNPRNSLRGKSKS